MGQGGKKSYTREDRSPLTLCDTEEQKRQAQGEIFSLNNIKFLVPYFVKCGHLLGNLEKQQENY